jgi:hypothetical protein
MVCTDSWAPGKSAKHCAISISIGLKRISHSNIPSALSSCRLRRKVLGMTPITLSGVREWYINKCILSKCEWSYGDAVKILKLYSGDSERDKLQQLTERNWVMAPVYDRNRSEREVGWGMLGLPKGENGGESVKQVF